MRLIGPRVLLLGLAVISVWQPASAQSYSRGQNISPAYEGWEEAADGTRYFLFGYMNRNWEEEIDVPVGPDNTVDPGGPDRRRHRVGDRLARGGHEQSGSAGEQATGGRDSG